MTEIDWSNVLDEEPSADRVIESDRDCKITLVSDEATFKVAKDPNRPFVVRSGDAYAQATGTEYPVRRLGDTGGAVHVNEGSVLV